MRSQFIIHPEELSRAWIDRAADAGITVLGIHPKGGQRAPVYLAEMVEMMKTPIQAQDPAGICLSHPTAQLLFRVDTL